MTNRSGKQYSFQIVEDPSAKIRELVESEMRGAMLKTIYSLFSQEVDQLCGGRFARKGEELCHRAGSDPGSVLASGQRIAVKKPRVKKDGAEMELETTRALRDYDILNERIKSHMMAGVSTRDYDSLLEEMSGGLGLKKSAVSEAFVKSSKGALDQVNGRDLSAMDICSIMVDGICFGDRTVVAALGITAKGKKKILGLREGETENWELCRDLFENLVSRGLDPSKPYFFVIDGGKALKKAIRKIFGERNPVQRCVRHKERNILKYLPEARHIEFRRRWKLIHGMATYTDALEEYEKLEGWLSDINHAAAESLRESEMETLTAIRLGLPGLLRLTLLSTNPIESAFSLVQPKVSRVKNWRSGKDQVSRWAAAALLAAENKFHSIQGFKQLPLLFAALEKFAIAEEKQLA
jgi:transposase-like protein